jgi:hypothetical protein
MPVDLQELCDRIVNAIDLVNVTFLGKLWLKLEYRLDVYRITWGSNIEPLLQKLELLSQTARSVSQI